MHYGLLLLSTYKINIKKNIVYTMHAYIVCLGLYDGEEK